KAPATLHLVVGNFPLERIAALTWQLGDGPKQPFDPAVGVERTADLSKADWKRGPAVIRVSLTTRAEEPQTFTEELPLRFQAPGPELPDLPAAERRRVVDQEKFTWAVPVKPAAGHQARVTVRQFQGNQEVASTTDPKDNQAAFTLKPGPNRLE